MEVLVTLLVFAVFWLILSNKERKLDQQALEEQLAEMIEANESLLKKINYVYQQQLSQKTHVSQLNEQLEQLNQVTQTNQTNEATEFAAHKQPSFSPSDASAVVNNLPADLQQALPTNLASNFTTNFATNLKTNLEPNPTSSLASALEANATANQQPANQQAIHEQTFNELHAAQLPATGMVNQQVMQPEATTETTQSTAQLTTHANNPNTAPTTPTPKSSTSTPPTPIRVQTITASNTQANSINQAGVNAHPQIAPQKAATTQPQKSKRRHYDTATKASSTQTSIKSGSRTPQTPLPNLFDQGIAASKKWLTTGNIPVKIGMLVLIASVIAFLKYATTMGWLHVPLWLKLLGIGIAALSALAFAWTKRTSKRSFALVVQGGSIGIILLDIFAAVRLYELMSPSVGFMLSVAMVLLTAILSVQQNAKWLAIMAIFAGFLAPIWLSDGTGNHVVLFSYYAILNVGIFILAWVKPWRELNLLGFVFTYLIGSIWGGLHYKPENFTTTEPFVVLFFIFYLIIPLRYAHHHANALKQDKALKQNQPLKQASNNQSTNSVQAFKPYKLSYALLFGTPCVTLIAQVALLYDNETQLALSCVAIGMVYLVLAVLLRKHRHTNNDDALSDTQPIFSTLQKAYSGLAASFFTLAVPIGLSAKATTSIFALEGVGAIWLGAKANPKQRHTLTWLAGVFLQLFSAIAFLVAYKDYSLRQTHNIFINDFYLSGLILVVAAWLCTWFCYHAVQVNQKYNKRQDRLSDSWLTNDALLSTARVFFFWGMGFWLGINLLEITRVYDTNVQYQWLVFFTLTAILLPAVYHYKKGYGDNVVWVTTALLLMIGGNIAMLQFLSVCFLGESINLSWVMKAWAVYAIGGFVVWRGLQTVRSNLIEFAISIWLLSLLLTASTLIYDVIPTSWNKDEGWYWSSIFAVWILLASVNTFYPNVVGWLAKRPVYIYSDHNEDDEDDEGDSNDNNDDQQDTITESGWQTLVGWVVIVVLIFVFIITTYLPGADGRWLPVINSVDGLQIGLAFLVVAWFVKRESLLSYLIAYFMFLATIVSMSVRMATHWTDWRGNLYGFDWMSDWQWLAIFGFWAVLATALLVLLNRRLKLNREVQQGNHQSSGYFLSESMLSMLQVLLNNIMLVLMVAWGIMLWQSGTLSPWVPLLNPIEILQWSILLLLWWWANGSDLQGHILSYSKRMLMLACLSLLLISVMSLRFVYHFYPDFTWDSSLFTTAVVQMTLTLIWSVLGVLSWLIGSKKASKPVWLLGAVLMVVVLAKLILVDRAHLGDVFGILSFFSYGFLCVVVGYFAPMPTIPNVTDMSDIPNNDTESAMEFEDDEFEEEDEFEEDEDDFEEDAKGN